MWHKIEISENNIEASTDKAVLIKMRRNSNYDGFVFWHPKKLVREEGKMFTFSFNDEFKFNHRPQLSRWCIVCQIPKGSCRHDRKSISINLTNNNHFMEVKKILNSEFEENN